ncbi:MAG: hypothetical protein Q7T72_07025, partial [Bacteroidales bacterium]|nr:hypothetical protein [Bacteroidales bacterium]
RANQKISRVEVLALAVEEAEEAVLAVVWDVKTVSEGADRKEIARWAILGKSQPAGLALTEASDEGGGLLRQSLFFHY